MKANKKNIAEKIRAVKNAKDNSKEKEKSLLGIHLPGKQGKITTVKPNYLLRLL